MLLPKRGHLAGRINDGEETMNSETEVKRAVQQAYTEVAKGQRCCTTDLTQLGPDGPAYSAEEMGSLPEGAALGLGCGNPTRILPIEPGMTVLDLGCGAGVDVFLAARKEYIDPGAAAQV